MHRIAALLAAALALSARRNPGEPDSSGPMAAAVVAWTLSPTIAFVSTRDDPTANPLFAAEIYLMDEDGTNPRRLTANAFGDGFPVLSPDGKRIVFDSNRRRRETEPLNTSDLFVMNPDGKQQRWLTRGSSATWSPDARNLAFHASASGTGPPIKGDPGAATFDSDIFVANLNDLLKGVTPRNVTGSPDAIEDDPDWSPDGQRIVFTSHAVADDPINSATAEIYLINPDGAGRTRLTFNTEEERGPDWSPDGARIVFACRRGGSDFELCVMNADGTGQLQLTDNTVQDLTPTWSPDGRKILFHRPVEGRFQLWTMNPDGTVQTQLTNTPGLNLLASWGRASGNRSSSRRFPSRAH